jgi:polysaccharide biosynthesis/export protein
MNTQADGTGSQQFAALARWLSRQAGPCLALIVATLLAGCASKPAGPPAPDETLAQPPAGETQGVTNAIPESLTLREGDMLNVSFPGEQTLDTVQEIRRDGKITLPLVGEVDAAGMTPAGLEKKLIDLYAPHLSSKQVVVEVQSSSFPVYVTGMVKNPGKILSDHPITAIEAVMEAGGFDYTKANLKDVTVIRREGKVLKHYKLNLKAVLEGQETDTFELKPDDILYVPERFAVF